MVKWELFLLSHESNKTPNAHEKKKKQDQQWAVAIVSSGLWPNASVLLFWTDFSHDFTNLKSMSEISPTAWIRKIDFAKFGEGGCRRDLDLSLQMNFISNFKKTTTSKMFQ